jgi:hypothetical protein
VDRPSELIIKASLVQNWLIKEGHLTGSKVVKILVDFSSWMEIVLKEMHQLLGCIDPNRVMDFAYFLEIPFDMETPVKLTSSLLLPPRPEVLRETLQHSTKPFSSHLEKTIPRECEDS